MTTLRPYYHALSTGKHLTEVSLVLLLIALLIDGYAMMVLVLAVWHSVKRKLKTVSAKEPRPVLAAGFGPQPFK